MRDGVGEEYLRGGGGRGDEKNALASSHRVFVLKTHYTSGLRASKHTVLHMGGVH